jgi:hypothetical protein
MRPDAAGRSRTWLDAAGRGRTQPDAATTVTVWSGGGCEPSANRYAKQHNSWGGGGSEAFHYNSHGFWLKYSDLSNGLVFSSGDTDGRLVALSLLGARWFVRRPCDISHSKALM